MENKNNFLKTGSLSVLWGVMAISLCAAPCAWADVDVVVPSEETLNIDSTVVVVRNLEVFGTANLYPGASVGGEIYVLPGTATDAPGAVNVYGCAPGNIMWVLDPTTIKPVPPVVTVYGQRFQIVTPMVIGEPFAPPADQPISGTLNVLDESDEVLFSLWIASDIDIHLRAPGSTEKERLEAELWVSPKVIYRQRRMPVVFATLRLPEGITEDDVDRDYPLLLYADENEGGVEANYLRMFRSCRRKTSRVKIFAFFNMAKLLEAAADNCKVMQLQVCGRLKTGQEFYGSDTIRIVSPRRKHWMGRASVKSKYRHR